MYLKYRVSLPRKGVFVVLINTSCSRKVSVEVWKRYIRKELVLSGYSVEFLGGPYDIPCADSIRGDLTSVMFDLLLIETDGALCW
jgi:hypothetical protein